MSTQESKIIMAQNIKRYMELKGVTNQQLCEDLGFKYTTFMDWIKAVTYPRIGKIEAMAQYFGCEKSDLIEKKNKDLISSLGPNNPAVRLGQMIKEYLAKHNLTTEQFIDLCGISRDEVNAFLNQIGNHNPFDADTASKIAHAIGMEPNNMLNTCFQKDGTSGFFFYFFFDENGDIADGITSFSQGLKDSDKLTLDGKPLALEAKEAIISALDLGLQAARSKNKENE